MGAGPRDSAASRLKLLPLRRLAHLGVLQLLLLVLPLRAVDRDRRLARVARLLELRPPHLGLVVLAHHNVPQLGQQAAPQRRRQLVQPVVTERIVLQVELGEGGQVVGRQVLQQRAHAARVEADVVEPHPRQLLAQLERVPAVGKVFLDPSAVREARVRLGAEHTLGNHLV